MIEYVGDKLTNAIFGQFLTKQSFVYYEPHNFDRIHYLQQLYKEGKFFILNNESDTFGPSDYVIFDISKLQNETFPSFIHCLAMKKGFIISLYYIHPLKYGNHQMIKYKLDFLETYFIKEDIVGYDVLQSLKREKILERDIFNVKKNKTDIL